MSALLTGEQFLSSYSSYSIFFFQSCHIFFEMKKTITAHNIQSVGARLAQGQVGQGPEQHDLVSGIPAHDGGENQMIFEIPSNPDHSMILFHDFITKDLFRDVLMFSSLFSVVFLGGIKT